MIPRPPRTAAPGSGVHANGRAAARDIIGRRLLAAAYREDLGDATGGNVTGGGASGGSASGGGASGGSAIGGDAIEVGGRTYPVRHHAFDRIELTAPVDAAPSELLAALEVDSPALAVELDNATVNLAIAQTRRVDIDIAWRELATRRGVTDAYGVALGLPGDAQAIAFEQLATDGHNLHPCGRTRLGWSRADVWAHDQESPSTRVEFVAILAGAHLGDDVGALLRDAYPQIPPPPDGYLLQPVHTWQLTHVLRARYADLFTDGTLREVPAASLRARPTTALRTVLLEPDSAGRRRYLKVSLDIQVTSTRRSISIASTLNGPVISRLLDTLVTDPRVLLMAEIAGAAMSSGRDVAAILRDGIGDRLGPGEVAIPGASLPARSPVSGATILAEVVDRYAVTRGLRNPQRAALAFVDEYARLLLPQLLRLLHAGVGLEAHLQNSIPVFVDGAPARMIFRDFAGLRLHRPRLAARTSVRLWPGSVIGTDDIDVVRAKLGYTAFQAHLGEILLRLTETHALDEPAAWRAVRRVVDEIYADGSLDAGDHAFLTAPTVGHKALVSMRISSASGIDGDIYRPVRNPLHVR